MSKAKNVSQRTRMKTVDGIVYNLLGFKKAEIDVRVTCDKAGQTLSLAYGSEMFLIPLESVSDMVKVVR